MFGWLFACVRLLRRLVWWSFLITLPFHFLPFLNGLIEGVFLSNLLTETYLASLDNFVSNVQGAWSMDWFSVPGAPGIHDVAVPPFHVVQLHDPQSWWEKLGLRRFDIDLNDDVAMDGYPIDLFGNLDVLYRRTPRLEQARQWHHFVYASPSIFQMEAVWFSEWDNAFNKLLQYHYANPAPTGAKFHYLSCPGNFLCDIWSTRGPALLHFTTESADLFDEFDKLKERQQVPGYLPVAVRIIEFPLTDPAELGLLPGQFPTPFNQLRSVTSHPHMWQVYRPFNKMAQVWARLGDRCDEAEKTYAQTYGRLYRLETWIQNKLLGLEDSDWPGIVRLPAVLLSASATQSLERAWEIVKTQSTELRKRYWGKNKGEQLAEWLDERAKEKQAEEDGKRKVDNMMAYILKTWTDALPMDLDAIAKKNPEAQKALDKMWEAVQRKPVAPAGDGKEEEEEEDGQQGRPMRAVRYPLLEAAWRFFDENAKDMEEIIKSKPGEDEFFNKIWDLIQEKVAKDGEKKD